MLLCETLLRKSLYVSEIYLVQKSSSNITSLCHAVQVVLGEVKADVTALKLNQRKT